jgi:putative flavoprotein involved in K+ transport
MPFPGPDYDFPTKDAMGDFLENYARHFDLPVRTGVRVERLSKQDGRFVMTAGSQRFDADNVVVAMSGFQKPYLPDFAAGLDEGIVQMHSAHYRNPAQLQDGGVLIVGASNSGAEIAVDVARGRKIYLSGRDVGQIPFRMDGLAARLFFSNFALRFVNHRVLTVDTPIGRKVRRKFLTHGGTLIRVKEKQLAALGVERVARVAGVRNGLPVLEDGRVMQVKNVIWCTGFEHTISWIDLPVFGELEPQHKRGVVEKEPGLYFVGLPFLYSASSTMVHGVGRDAAYISEQIALRSKSSTPELARRLSQSSARQ